MDHPQSDEIGESVSSQAGSKQPYEVVARRYRPKSFEELIGQGGLAHALQKAIETNRVGHAYLFTGARGVGKTSTARIFSKALNCEQGPTASPCNECDTCRSITAGSDVDVLEIDGASNRGIDEIRQLRSNVSVRPSRARYKVYIIDEVHMLTTPAFNALLKTLEEPPPHVKFIFCTTDPEKLPITVLSRCQRFDFAPVTADAIGEKLQQILQREDFTATPEAVRLIARRAAGSVRDSQSLLEQVMAFAPSRNIDVEAVHQLLGTVRGGRLVELLEQLQTRNTAAAFQTLEAAIQEGVDVGRMAEQLLGALRDTLALASGCPAELFVCMDASDEAAVRQLADATDISTLLAMAQIVDQTLTRMRFSTEPRVLLEITLCRLCQLESMQALSDVINQLGEIVPQPGGSPSRSSAPAAASGPSAAATDSASEASSGGSREATALKKNGVSVRLDPADERLTARREGASEQPVSPPGDAVGADAESSPVERVRVTESSADPPNRMPLEGELSVADATRLWRQAIEQLEDTTADLAAAFRRVAISGPNTLVVTLDSLYNKEMCERPERRSRIEEALTQLAGRRLTVSFAAEPGAAERKRTQAAPRVSRQQRVREIERHPFVQQAVELLGAEVEDVKLPREPRPS